MSSLVECANDREQLRTFSSFVNMHQEVEMAHSKPVLSSRILLGSLILLSKEWASEIATKLQFFDPDYEKEPKNSIIKRLHFITKIP